MNILFRADSSSEIGHGHIMRCLTLATYLELLGHSITFCLKKNVGSLDNYILDRGFAVLQLEQVNQEFSSNNLYEKWLQDTEEDDARSVLDLIEEQSFDWVIVDHYGIGKKWETIIKSVVPKMMVVDDLNNREHYCDILIDTTLNKSESLYKELSPSSDLFVGSRFVILRKEFLGDREKAFLKRDQFTKPKNMFINLGGTDPLGLTVRIVELLKKNSLSSIHKVVVLNEKADSFKRLQDICSKDNNFELISYSKDMNSLMLNADIAFGAAGVSSYERACLGLPTIILQTAQNQDDNIKAFKETGTGLTISLDELDILNDKVDTHLETMLKSTNYKDIVQNSFKNVSPLGIFNILERIHGDSLYSLRKADSTDIEQVYTWQAFPGARKFSRNKSAPIFEHHKKWFLQALTNLKRNMYILELFDIPLGFLRVDENEKGRREVSIIISHAFYGNGLGKVGLNLLRSKFTGVDLFAYIEDQNMASIKLFEKSNYKKLEPNWYISKG